jgi:Zn-finger nucleic acid-binding protein
MPRCPSCFVPMTRTEEDAIRAHVCPNCFGTWITSVAMLRRVRLDVAAAKERSPQNPTDDSKLPPLSDLVGIVAEANNKKPQRCPECERPMLKDRFQQMIPVTIDRCKPCNSIWLDTGEYNLIRRLYVEMILSEDPRIVQLREKIGSVGAQWEARSTLSDSLSNNTPAGFTLSVLVNLLTP